ncbi:MAG TPA: hypothetical protein VL156_13315 [Terriglobales bacterium]|jgi:hypothetical protein|nr:hypothetical protein [Terriglobales bacterium]
MSRLRELFGSGSAPLQPVPRVTPADIERVVRRDFAETEVDAALAILAEYGPQAWHREPARVRLAALKLANGSLEGLRRAVDRAKLDYRDVLAPAEYPKFTEFGLRARRLRSRVQQQIFSDDWQQYERWLKK